MCRVRADGAPKQKRATETVDKTVLGGAHWMKSPKSRDLAGLVLAYRIWCKVGA